MKIVLVKPPATYANWYKQPSLGLTSLYESLLKDGHEVRILDAYYNGWSQDKLCEEILSSQPDILGISAMTHEVCSAAEICRIVKTSIDVITVVGGCHVTALPADTLTEFPVFDYGLTGEGEVSFPKLVQSISNHSDLAETKGLVWRDRGECIVNVPAEAISPDYLDQIHKTAFKEYYGNDLHALAGRDSYHPIFTSRGCPYNCAFCMQVLGRKLRYRSIDSIISEIEYVIEHYGCHTINFSDELFLFDNERTRKLLNAIIDRGLPQKIRWCSLTRANTVSEELIALAKKAGCFELEMGVESGDADILVRINKKITLEQIHNAVKIIKDAGIKLGTFYILGHPGETAITARKTVDLAIKLNTDTIAMGVMVPYPGTAIYQMALNGTDGYRLLSKDWSLYDKYGGKALALDGVSYKHLESLQKKAIFMLYLRNFRLLDLISYLWKRRKSICYFILKKFS